MSGDDGLRAALVVWLADTYESAYQHATVEPDFDWDVDALLALPEVAALRAKAAAADRVRELAEELLRRGKQRAAMARQHGDVSIAKQLRSGALARLADVVLIRRALDGDGS